PRAAPRHEGNAAAPSADHHPPQQRQGQPGETSVQPPVPAAAVDETAYLPPQGHPEPVSGPTVHPGYGEAVTYGTPPPGPLPAAAPVPPASAHRAAATAAPGPAPGAPDADGPAYGPATLAGTARVTDAQRARAEGRSPVIEPGMQPAALTALLGLLLAGGAALGTYALLVPLIALQGLTAAGWF